jgi:hypothetical protein
VLTDSNIALCDQQSEQLPFVKMGRGPSWRLKRAINPCGRPPIDADSRARSLQLSKGTAWSGTERRDDSLIRPFHWARRTLPATRDAVTYQTLSSSCRDLVKQDTPGGGSTGLPWTRKEAAIGILGRRRDEGSTQPWSSTIEFQ